MSRVRTFRDPVALTLASRKLGREREEAARKVRKARARDHAAIVMARALEDALDRLEFVVALRDVAVDHHVQLTDPLTAACALVAKGHRMVPADVGQVQVHARAEALFSEPEAKAT